MSILLSADDLNKVKLERGKTPENIEQKCLDLCKDYLGGIWLELTTDQIIIKRLSGGLTNQTYYCAVNQSNQISDSKVPQIVAIRLYADKHFDNSGNEKNSRLLDTIIALMISENGLGPQIYGLFESGQIQRYYPHRNFKTEEQKDPKIVDGLARRLARIHAMEVPIKKSGNWIFDYYDQSFKLANDRFDLKDLINKSNSQTLKTYDLVKEIEWLKKTLLDINSPQVFSHNDFRGPNILITDSNDIILCDFEYSSYGFRGFDFGAFFIEWSRDQANLNQCQLELPSDQIIKSFVASYIEESVKLKENEFISDKRNSFEHIFREVKVFCLAELMFIILLFLKMNESIINDIPFDKLNSMVTIESDYKSYQRFKQMFIDGNVIQISKID